MQNATDAHQAPAPFLTAYAVPRTPCPETPGRYSPEQEMWVVDHEGEERPLIDVDRSMTEVTTKTKSLGEMDDTALETVGLFI